MYLRQPVAGLKVELMPPTLCPSCNETIGISVAWCAACAAWFRAIKEEVCTVDPPYGKPTEAVDQWFRDWLSDFC